MFLTIIFEKCVMFYFVFPCNTATGLLLEESGKQKLSVDVLLKTIVRKANNYGLKF